MGFRNVEPAAEVTDFEMELSVALPQFDANYIGAAIFSSIVEGFLSDAIKGRLNRLRQATKIGLAGVLDHDAGARKLLDQIVDGCLKVQIVEFGRTDALNRPPAVDDSLSNCGWRIR